MENPSQNCRSTNTGGSSWSTSATELQTPEQMGAYGTSNATSGLQTGTLSKNSDDDLLREKNRDKATVANVPGHMSEASDVSPTHRTWKYKLFRLAPLAGICCMLVAIASLIAELGILVGSRQASKSSWAIPPSTYLAICTAVANQAARFAAFQGLVVAWWYSALHGTTLAQLHRKWHSGMTLGGAIRAGPNMGLVGLACIMSTLVSIDGPLLQKATTIVSVPISGQSQSLNVTISQEVPTDYTGFWSRAAPGAVWDRWSAMFNTTIPSVDGNVPNNIIAEIPNLQLGDAWIKDEPIPGVVRGCSSTCTATITAPALAVTSCTSDVIKVNYSTTIDGAYYNREDAGALPLSNDAFAIQIALVVDKDQERINLFTGYSQSRECAGEFNYTVCTLASAIGEYDVDIDADKITLAAGLPRIVALANNSRVSLAKYESTHNSTLGGFVQVASQKYQNGVSYVFSGTGGVQSWVGGSNLYQRYIVPGPTSERCESFNDPLEDVLKDLNRLMVILGATAIRDYDKAQLKSLIDPNLPMETISTAYLRGSHEVYETNLHWFAAAAVVELVCIALILPTYFGWWRLGRPVSFSPIETAKAFEAPLLQGLHSNSSGSDAVKAVGNTRVQYGEVLDEELSSGAAEKQAKIVFAHPIFVKFPQNNAHFGI